MRLGNPFKKCGKGHKGGTNLLSAFGGALGWKCLEQEWAFGCQTARRQGSQNLYEPRLSSVGQPTCPREPGKDIEYSLQPFSGAAGGKLHSFDLRRRSGLGDRRSVDWLDAPESSSRWVCVRSDRSARAQYCGMVSDWS